MFKNFFIYMFVPLGMICSSLSAWDVNEYNNDGQPYEFQVIPKEYRFSNHFEFQSKDVPVGRVKSSSFRLRTNYDLGDRHGWQATGITRLFSLGSLFTWAKQIDIYDTEDNYIGMISGEIFTTAKAKYTFYNSDGCQVGYAYIDYEGLGFTIQHPEISSRMIAQFVREFNVSVKDSWNITVYEPEEIDFRILRIFSAFIVDTQSVFHHDQRD